MALTKKLQVNYLKLDGYVNESYVVNVVPCDILGNHQGSSIDLVIDTGAHITCIPQAALFNDALFVSGVKILTSGYMGGVTRSRTKMITLEIPTDTGSILVTPKKGVLVTDRPVGLLGWDILAQCDFMKAGDDFIVEYYPKGGDIDGKNPDDKA